MANNRLFITCGVCGSRAMLFKYFPATGRIKEGMDDWLNEHSDICIDSSGGQPRMLLVWENDSEFDERYQDGHPLGRSDAKG